MARFYNEMDVEELCRKAARIPEVAPYARYLAAWVEVVNSNSDGWPYWRTGSAAGCKLAALIEAALQGGEVTQAQYGRAIGGIKAVATRQQVKHGSAMQAPVLA